MSRRSCRQSTNKLVAPSGFPALQKTYTLKEIPVTALFEVLFRGDIGVTRNLSVGPIAGLRSGFPVFGGILRVPRKNVRRSKYQNEFEGDGPATAES